MASLADCIRQAGASLHADDRDALLEHLRAGLGTDQAVDQQMRDLDMEMRTIGRQAQTAGAEVAPLEGQDVEAGAVPVRPVVLEQPASPLRRGEETLEAYGLDPGKTHKTRDVALALERRQRELSGTIAEKDFSDEARDKVADWMVEEAIAEMGMPGDSGTGWYTSNWRAALDTMAQEFPELADETHEGRALVTMLAGITSDGQKVAKNMQDTFDLYEGWRSTGNLDPAAISTQRNIAGNIEILQGLIAEHGVAGTQELLLTEHKVGTLNQIAKEMGVKFSSGYPVTMRVPMAAVLLGPKVGVFYSNLAGLDGYLTIDRWFTRTFDRYRGGENKITARATGLPRVKVLAGNPGMSDAEALAIVQEEAASYKAKGYKNGTDLEKASNTEFKHRFEELRDKPAGPREREFMVNTTRRASELLKERGFDVSTADLQAVLWYFEKRLYATQGVRPSVDESFAEGAARVAQARRTARPDGPDAPGVQPIDRAAEDEVLEQSARAINPGDDPVRLEQPAGERGAAGAAQEVTLGDPIPEGWFVHGRAGQQDLRSDAPIQMTRDWDVASQYAGQDGSVWMVGPTSTSTVLDLSSEHSEDMDQVVAAALAQLETGYLPMEDDILASADSGEVSPAEVEQAIRANFAPSNIVESAAAFDDFQWANWLADAFAPDLVLTPDGAVALGPDVESVRVQADNPGDDPVRLEQFAGERALDNLTRPRSEFETQAYGPRPEGGDQLMTGLVDAQTMAAQGRPAELIRQKTGWFRGADQKWRFEIDDSQAALHLPSVDDEVLFGDPGQIQRDAIDLGQEVRHILQRDLGTEGLYTPEGDVPSSHHIDTAIAEVLANGRFSRQDADRLGTLLGGMISTRRAIMTNEWLRDDALGALRRALNDLKVRPLYGESQLHQVLDHPRLYDAYPSLASVNVKVAKLPEGVGGNWESWSNTINISETLADDADAVQSILLHEVQHAIQTEENFARGGNSSVRMKNLLEDAYNVAAARSDDQFKQWLEDNFGTRDETVKENFKAQAREELHKANQYEDMLRLREYVARDRLTTVGRHVRGLLEWAHDRELVNANPGLSSEVSGWSAPGRRTKGYNEWLRQSALKVADALEGAIGPEYIRSFEAEPKSVKALVAAARREFERTLRDTKKGDDLQKAMDRLKLTADDVRYSNPYELYRRLAGEVEARTTQARRKLTADERRETPIFQSEDVKRSEQLVYFAEGNVELPMESRNKRVRSAAGYYEPDKHRIVLRTGADKSTFLHESAHFFLEVMRDLSSIDPTIAQDLEAAAGWFESQGAQDDARLQHELFASGFETYLMEGRAPTPDLAALFSKFRAWLLHVYRNLLRTAPFARNKLGTAELDDAMREVFDRLLASDDAIIQAREDAGQGERLPIDTLGLPPDRAEAYMALVESAGEEAESEVTVAVMQDLQRDTSRWWRNEVREAQTDIELEVSAQPAYRARDILSGDRLEAGADPIKLSSGQVAAIVGGERAKTFNKMASKDGIDIDIAAGMLGFPSGRDLVLELAGTRNKAQRKAWVKAQAEDRVRLEHGDMLTSGELEKQAAAAVRSDKSIEVLLEQIKLVNEALGPEFLLPMTVPGMRGQYKTAAERAVGQTPLAMLRLPAIQQREQRHGREAVRAASQGDWVGARDALLRQLQQRYLWRASKAALERSEVTRRVAKGMQRGARYERVLRAGDTYKNHLDALLSVFDFRKRPVKTFNMSGLWRDLLARAGDGNPAAVSSVLDSNDQALRELEGAQDGQQLGLEFRKLDDFMADGQSYNYRQLTPEQLEEVHEALDSLNGMAKAAAFLITQGEAQTLEGWTNSLLGSVSANALQTRKSGRFGPDEKRTAGEWLQGLLDGSLTMTNIIRGLDGYQDDGVATNLILLPLQDAATAEAELVNSTNSEVADLFGQYYGRAHQKKLMERVYDPALDESISKNDALTIALYWGSETGRQRVRDGWGFTDEEVQTVLDTKLEENDLEFVERVWGLLERWWTPTADLHRDLFGYTPQRVTHESFTAAGGREMAGGYFPIKYNPRASATAEQHQLQSQHQGDLPLNVKAKHGAAQARLSRVVRPLRSNVLAVMTSHLADTIHHTTHDRALWDVGRLLAQDSVKTAISDGFGEHTYNYLTQRIREIRDGSREIMDAEGKALQFIRNNTTVSMLGLSARTVLLQPFGTTNSVVRLRMSGVGLPTYMAATAQVLSSPIATNNTAQELSGLMRTREQTQDVAIRRLRSRIQQQGSMFDPIREMAMTPIVKTQYWSVDLPTWVAAFKHFSQGESLADGQTLEELRKEDSDKAKRLEHASKLADQVVRTAQGGGSALDISRNMEGGPIRRLFTNFLTYAITTYSLQAENYRRTQLALRSDELSAGEKAAAMYNFTVNTFVTVTVPAILNAGLNAFTSGGEEEPEEFTERVAKEQVSFLMSMNPWSAQASGMPLGFEYTGPQGLSILPAAWRASMQWQQGEMDQAAWKATIGLLGVGLGLPSTQLNRTIFGALQGAENNADPDEYLKLMLFGPERNR